MKFLQGILLACSMLMFIACSSDDAPKPDPAHRTVLVYIGAENSLYSYVSDDLDEMIQGAGDIPASDNLLVYVDDRSTPRIYKIGMEKGKGTSSVVKEYSTDLCSSDPAVLRDVCRWVTENYSAASYGLVLWSHANGWLPAQEVRDTRSIITDNNNNTSSNSGPEMEISALKEVLMEVFGNKGLDFILFDACFMQSVEVAYEFRNVAQWLVATPAEMPGTGSPYDKLIKSIFASSVDVEGIVNTYYNEYVNDSDYEGIIISAVKTSELDAFAQVSAPLVQHYLLNNAMTDGVFAYLPIAVNSFPFYHDMKGLMMKNVPESELQEWMAQLQKTVPYLKATDTWFSVFAGWGGGSCRVNHEQCSGLSMYVSSQMSGSTADKARWNEYVKTLEWYKDVCCQ